jgi:hypothetical protein
MDIGTWQAERADAYAARMEPILAELRANGITSFKATAKELTRRGVEWKSQGPAGLLWAWPLYLT